MGLLVHPRYAEVATELRDAIHGGELPLGAQLPSIAALASHHHTSTTTVRQALSELEKEGLVVGRQGKGTFVRKPRRKVRWVASDLYSKRATDSPLREVAKKSKANAHYFDNDSVETVATESIARRLRIAVEESVMRTSYMFYVDNNPTMKWTSFEPLAITRGTTIEHPERGGVKGVVARFDSIDVRIDRVNERVGARLPTVDEQDELQLPNGVPVLTIDRTYYCGDLPVETAECVAAGDSYTIEYGLRIPDHPADIPGVVSEHSVDEEVDYLISAWRDETRFVSSPNDIAQHWAYRRLIKLGDQALGRILEDLKLGGTGWHWALAEITGQNPAASTHSPAEADAAWAKWADEELHSH